MYSPKQLRSLTLKAIQSPDYRPTDLLGLARLIGIYKKDRPKLKHVVRSLLSEGALAMVNGDRLVSGAEAKSTPPPSPSLKKTSRIQQRPIFTPSSRGSTPKAEPKNPPLSKKPGKSGKNTVVGKINFRQSGSAVVIPSAGESQQQAVQIFPEDTGIALQGDIVEVAIIRKKPRGRNAKENEIRGRVINIIERGRANIVGTLHQIRKTYYVVADDPRFSHEISVSISPDINEKPEAGDKVVVQLKDWENRYEVMEGLVTERLGKTFEPSAELLGIYRKFNLATSFPEAVEQETIGIPTSVGNNDIKGRLDIRKLPTITIDPDDAKDFDDALSVEQHPNGTLTIGIHIADVSHYVKPGTAIDKEARHRGNSTYLVGTVIPMLPEKLSNGLCSLVEAQDRLTKSVFITFSKSGVIQNTRFANTVIRSNKRLTYKQAYAFLFEDDIRKIKQLPLPPKHQTGSTGRALSSLSDKELRDIQSWVRLLWSVASVLRKARMQKGSLDLDMPETKIFVDEHGYADRLEKVENDESHQLIEEFMLAANESVARITRTKRYPSLYRVHDDPDEEKLEEFHDELALHGIRVGDLANRSELVRLLQILSDHPQGHILRTQLLRSLKKAAYRATPDGHYGLHKKDYTHFTSPIRRYSDLVVHRVIANYIENNKTPGKTPRIKANIAEMTALGEHLSQTETNSQEAERESVKIKLLEYFERDLQKTPRPQYEAVITDVKKHGLFIELTESLAFGMLPIMALPDDIYITNNAEDALIGKRSRKSYGIGEKLMVEVYKVDRQKRFIDFRPVGSGTTPPSRPQKANVKKPTPSKGKRQFTSKSRTQKRRGR